LVKTLQATLKALREEKARLELLVLGALSLLRGVWPRRRWRRLPPG